MRVASAIRRFRFRPVYALNPKQTTNVDGALVFRAGSLKTPVKRFGSWDSDGLPRVSVVVPFVGLANFICSILKGNLQKGSTMEPEGRV